MFSHQIQTIRNHSLNQQVHHENGKRPYSTHRGALGDKGEAGEKLTRSLRKNGYREREKCGHGNEVKRVLWERKS